MAHFFLAIAAELFYAGGAAVTQHRKLANAPGVVSR
jgi:hypothetical protein